MLCDVPHGPRSTGSSVCTGVYLTNYNLARQRKHDGHLPTDSGEPCNLNLIHIWWIKSCVKVNVWERSRKLLSQLKMELSFSFLINSISRQLNHITQYWVRWFGQLLINTTLLSWLQTHLGISKMKLRPTSTLTNNFFSLGNYKSHTLSFPWGVPQ